MIMFRHWLCMMFRCPIWYSLMARRFPVSDLGLVGGGGGFRGPFGIWEASCVRIEWMDGVRCSGWAGGGGEGWLGWRKGRWNSTGGSAGDGPAQGEK